MNKHRPRTRLNLVNVNNALHPTRGNANVQAREAFARNFSKIMQESGYGQSELAAEIWGTTKDTQGFTVAKNRHLISKYVSGKSFPSRETLSKIARVLKREISDFLPEAVIGAMDAGTAPAQFREIEPGKFLLTINKVMSLDNAIKAMTFFKTLEGDDADNTKVKRQKGKAS